MPNKQKLNLINRWHHLNKGARVAICILAGTCIATAITVPTVIAINNSRKQPSVETIVSIESNTLGIKECSSQLSGYRSYIIFVKDTNSIKSLPDTIEVIVNGNVINKDQYQYSSSDGVLRIPNSYQGKIIIKADAKTIYEVNMSSKTLKIDKKKINPNEDLDLTISLCTSSVSLALPNTLSLVVVGNKPFNNYTYNSSTGNFHIDKEFVIGDVIITAEATDITKSAFKVTFDCENCNVYIYEDQDYSKTPIKSNVAYSYNVDEQKFSKDGKGQVNFRIEVPDNYEINYIWPKGIYKNLKQVRSANATDIYRLTQICGDITIKITTTKRYVKNFSCIGDNNNKTFTMKWDVRNIDNVDSTKITISHNGISTVDTLPSGVNIYTINDVIFDELYNINIAPISSKGSIQTLSVTKMLSNIGHEVDIPRLELTTDDGLYPTINKEASWDIYTLGFHEGRDPFVNSLIEIYNGENKIFTSSNESRVDEAKIKIRGNGSVLHYNEKKPLKIKLSNPSDMLNGLRKHQTSGVNYTNKDWVLLPYCPNMSDLIGYTSESTFNFSYSHEYAYLTVYINNDYQGLYTLVEANTEGLGEGDAQSRYKVNKDGFIIENDYYYYKEDVSFASIISNNQYQNTFTYPDLEDKKTKYLEYVANVKTYFDEVESAIKNNDHDLFNKYLDIESFAKWLVQFDFIMQGDADGANRFLVKYNKDSKLYMGTPWDYEDLMGACPPGGYEDIRDKKEFYYYYIKDRIDFKKAIKECFDKYKNNVLSDIDNEILKINSANFDKLMNYEKTRHNLNYKNYADTKAYIDGFFKKRIIELENKYN